MEQKIVRKKQETKKFESYKDGVKITWRNPKEDNSLLALLTATVSGITVYGCKLFEKKDGSTFVAMPSQKNGGKYYSIVYMNKDLLDMLNDWAVSAYNSDDGTFELQPLVKGGK